MTTDRMVRSGRVTLAVRDFGGSGPDLLLLHGATRSLADWSLMLPHLQRHHRVAAMDLRNHGRSGDGPWEWGAVLDDVRAVVDALGMSQPAVVGHSLGGMIAAMYAAGPGSCRAAVNLDGHGSGLPGQYVDIDPQVVRSRQAELRELNGQLMPAAPLTGEQVAAAKAGVGHVAAQMGIARTAVLEAWERTVAAQDDGTFVMRPGRDEALAVHDAIAELDLLELYPRARCPLLIVDAARDPALPTGPDGHPAGPPWLGEMMASFRRSLERDLARLTVAHPHVEVRRVDLTHGLVMEDPELVAGIVTEFITKAFARTDQGLTDA